MDKDEITNLALMILMSPVLAYIWVQTGVIAAWDWVKGKFK